MGFVYFIVAWVSHSRITWAIVSMVRPPIDPEPIHVLHTFLDGLWCHEITELEIAF